MNKDAIIKLVNEQLWTKGEADVPQFKAGDTITVSYKIVEGNKERVQSFRGVVIQIKTSTTSPATPKAWIGASRLAVSRYHLLTNPAMGGIPIRERAARVKHHMVTGIRRPMPRS